MGLLVVVGESPLIDLLADDPMRSALAIAGIVILIVVVLRMGWKRKRRRASRPAGEPSPTPIAEPRSLHAAGEFSEILVQIQSLTREIEGRLDTRVRHANRLLQESEQVLTRLEQLIHEARGIVAEGRLDASSSIRRTKPGTQDPGAQDPKRGQNVNVVSDRANSTAETEATPEAADTATAADTQSDAPTHDDEHGDIRRLAADGMAVTEIATRVGRPVGEVELILALAKTADRGKSP